jgi:hypothetical protein
MDFNVNVPRTKRVRDALQRLLQLVRTAWCLLPALEPLAIFQERKEKAKAKHV